MEFDVFILKKINSLVGKSPLLDAFGRAGAEWVIIAMFGWFVSADLVAFSGRWRLALWPLLFLGCAWAVGWLIGLVIGLVVKKPRPYVDQQNIKLLFTPLMSWKSFPSDHAMSAWLIFFVAGIFQLPWLWALLPLALWVSWGRVYAGVHYPFDIIGGVAVAGLMATFVYCVLMVLG